MKYVIWGSILSPFSLKVRALCNFARVDYEWFPGDGGVIKGPDVIFVELPNGSQSPGEARVCNSWGDL